MEAISDGVTWKWAGLTQSNGHTTQKWVGLIQTNFNTATFFWFFLQYAPDLHRAN